MKDQVDMKTEPARKARTKTLILNSTDENIIRMIAKFRYAGSLDVAHYLFSASSLTHVRSLLARLAGGTDHRTHSYLYRFQLPMASTGNRERIFCLGAKARAFLAGELGQLVDSWYRPYKQRFLSFTNVLHHLILTRFVVSAHTWCRKQKNFRLVQTRLCYELAQQPAAVGVEREGKTEKIKVIPDAWLLFERLRDGSGVHQCFIPVLIELDRGTEHQRRFRDHVRSRIAFIRSGAYKDLFHSEAVVIAYVTTGQTPEYRETRRRAMCAWTKEVLAELHMENWSSIFRFASVVFDQLYTSPMFEEPVWYRPDSPTPVPLFTPETSLKGKVYGQ